MTCIVAYTDGKNVWMGADSAGVSNWALMSRNDPKIYKVGDFMFGFTSSFRMGQILGFTFVPPEHPNDMNVFEYMVKHFIGALRTTLKDEGFARVNSGEDQGGTFLVGYRGRIFRIESDFQVGESRFPYDSVGCGQDIALGAMHALRECGMYTNDPNTFLTRSLKAAEAFSAGVRSPFLIEERNNGE